MKKQAIITSLIWILFFVSECVPASAQTLVVQNFSRAQGLPEEHTNSLFKDSRGFLWITTSDGLFRYDGYYFKTFKKIPGEKNCLISNSVKCVAEDAKGNLWIGTSAGISVMSPQGGTFVNYPSPKKDSAHKTFPSINAITRDRENRMWVSTYAGLFLFDDRTKQFHAYHFTSHNASFRSDITGVLQEDEHGSFWITSGEGLIYFDPDDGNFQIFVFKPEDKKNFKFNNQIQCEQINPYNHDELWIGTWGAGLLCFNVKTKTWKQFLYDLSGNAPNISNIIFTLHFSDSSHIYFTTAQKFGTFNLENDHFVFFPQTENQPYSVPTGCNYFFQDDQNAFWICNSNGFTKAVINHGLEFISSGDYNPSAFYEPLNCDTLFFVTVYHQRSFGMMYQRTHDVHFIPLPLLDKNFSEANEMLRDKNGLFWLISTKGIYTFDLKRNLLTQIVLDSIEPRTPGNLGYSDVESDAAGNLYFASYGHPVVVKKLKGNFFVIRDSLAEKENDFPFTMITDPLGNLLMLSRKNLEEYDPVRQHFHYFPDLLIHFFADSSSYFEGIAIDHNHRLWLASSEGVIRFDANAANKDSSLKKFLPGEFVQSIIADENGFIWAQSFSGFYRINPEKNYSLLIGDEYGTGSPATDGGMGTLADGTVILTTSLGPILIQPSQMKSEHRTVPMLLQNFKVFDRDLPLDTDLNSLNEVKLHHDQNSFTLEFNALEIYNPSKLHYEYRLKGIDKDWVNGDKLFASYSQLEPGNYDLEVKANSSDGNIMSNVRTLSIIIVPAFYQTWWFKLLVIFIIIGLLVWLVSFISTQRLRQKLVEAEKQKEIDAVRNRVSRDMHDEVGAMLTRISVMSDASLLEDEATAKMNLEKVRNLAHQSAKGLSEIIWSVNPKQDHLENMLAYFRQYIQDFLDDTQFEYKINFPEKLEAINVNPELRRNLFLVLKESLNNVVKYSKAKLICVEFLLNGKNFSMKISDDGVGFDISNSKTGNGLPNMKARMEAVKCSCNIYSQNGKGTRAEIEGTLF